MTMTTATLVARAHDGEMRDDDPAPKPVRRRFSEEYKAAIVSEYEQATERGAKGEILRREGLYTSQIVEWKRVLEAGKPGTGPSKRSSQTQRELERLRRRNARLEDQLQRHKKALEIQGKASELLAQLLAESEDPSEQQP
jgi:transposase